MKRPEQTTAPDVGGREEISWILDLATGQWNSQLSGASPGSNREGIRTSGTLQESPPEE